ncbi:MAG TPA: oligosaccharide flippase family protein [Mucilaginibacter sp.]|jgi:O-antigen/teichoic acid export membrane protein|nr:oligosaccharide flippase family protein [Mucilaginibacter sp.]
MSFLKNLVNKHTLSLASNAIMPVVGMVTVAMLAHSLKTELGNYVLFLMTYTLANFFRSGFLQTALIKFYSGASEERAATVIGSTWSVAFLITIILVTLSFTVHFIFRADPSVGIISKWFGIFFCCTLPSSIALWVLQAEERFDRVFILQFIGQGSIFLSVAALVIIGHTHFQNVVYAYCWSATFTSLFSIVWGWARIRSITHRSKACIKELVNFGKYSVGTSISSYLLRASDTYIIKFMFVNSAIVGVYYLPQRLMEVIEIPLRSFIATAYPAMAAAVQRNDKQYMTYVMKKYAGILTILLIPVSIAAFIAADLVIKIIGGETFVQSDAANVFRIFMSFAILLPVDRFFGITLDILNKPHINMIKVILMLAVNVVGDFVGIYLTHNLYGVALSSIFTFLTGIIYGYWILKRNLHFKLRDIFKLGITETKLLTIEIIAKLNRNLVNKSSS